MASSPAARNSARRVTYQKARLILSPTPRLVVAALLRWFSLNARDLPWRHTRDPYAIWTAEVMLQQTQVKTVVPYWKRWMRMLPTIEAVAGARLEFLYKLWEGLGYYTRVRNLQNAAQQIVSKHGGKFPEKFEDVLALPGIGPYTAGAICSIAFNQPKPVLDGNVIRVLTRLFGISGNPRSPAINAGLWSLAEQLVLTASKQTAHRSHTDHRTWKTQRAAGGALNVCSSLNQALMELGALVCTPKLPQCGHCPVRKLCTANREGRAHQLPNLGRRQVQTWRRFVAFVAENSGRYLVCQRPAGVVNGGLWEFPNVETTAVNGNIDTLTQTFLGTRSVSLEPLLTIKHTITRYRMTLEAHRVRGRIHQRPARGRWLNLKQLHALPFPSAHRKILLRLSTL